MNRRDIQKQEKTKPASRGKDDKLFGLTLDVPGTWIFFFFFFFFLTCLQSRRNPFEDKGRPC